MNGVIGGDNQHEVVVFFTDKERIVNASIVERVEGKNAIPLAIQLLKEWASYEGNEKCLRSTKIGILHKDFLTYTNLYTELNSDQHELIALIKK